MKLLFRNWTYEIYYKREIIRISILIVFFVFILFFRIYGPRIENEPKWFSLVFLLIYGQIPFYFVFSLLRFIQIADNKENAFQVSEAELDTLRLTFKKETFYFYEDHHYFYIKKDKPFPSGKYVLVRIGKQQMEKDNILTIIHSNKLETK